MLSLHKQDSAPAQVKEESYDAEEDSEAQESLQRRKQQLD